ncbi:AbrB family transcriptional regulator [Pseudochelatococcus sp. B33]
MKHLPALAVLAAAAASGYLASTAGLPLAWLLGALVPTAIGSLLGVDVLASRRGRQLGQLLVGTSVGLYVTVESLGLILTWFPAMVVTALVSILMTALLCIPYARASRLDATTAFFCLTPGGLAEMARTGEKEGAEREPVALSQTIRVALLVCIMPPLLLTFGVDGGMSEASGRLPVAPLEVAVLLLSAGICVFLVRRTGMNNPWMIGGLLGSGAIAASGFIDGRMPYALFALGQFLIGLSIGARFRRASLVKLPRVCVMTVVFIAVMTVLLFGYSVLLHLATGIDLSSTALAAAPGGLAEMALTAQLLHLNVALVTSFHIVRSFTVNAFSQHFFRLFRRIGLFVAVDAMLRRWLGPSPTK